MSTAPDCAADQALPDAARSDSLFAALAPQLERILTPALVVDLDAAQHNINAMLRRCGSPTRWRPHVKTVKQAALIRRLFQSGVQKLKCATPLELAQVLRCAVALRDESTEPGPAVDILVAYPHRGANLRALLDLRAAHPEAIVRVLANDPAHLGALHQCVQARGESAPVSVYLDVNLGMDRTGSSPEIWAGHVHDGFEAFPAIEVNGLHGYDGHHKADAREDAHLAYARLVRCAEAFAQPEKLELITSGTHSYAHALTYPEFEPGAHPWRHAVSAGTILLSDGRSQCAASDLQLRQAAFILARVIDQQGHRLTLDAGSKAITPDAHGPSCRLLAYPELRPLRASEEHLPVHIADPLRVDQARLSGTALHAPKAGELVWLVPDHVCTTVNLHRQALYLRDGAYAGTGEISAASRYVWGADADARPPEDSDRPRPKP